MNKAIKGWHEVRGASKEELEAAKAEVYAKYGDIIHLPHPISKNHRPMSPEKRAAQFAPFAALTGYDEEIDEAGRLTDERIFLDESVLAEIDEAMARIQEKIGKTGSVRAKVVHFVADEKKEGGKYFTDIVLIRKIDDFAKCIVTKTGEKIFFRDIAELAEEREGR